MSGKKDWGFREGLDDFGPFCDFFRFFAFFRPSLQEDYRNFELQFIQGNVRENCSILQRVVYMWAAILHVDGVVYGIINIY